jgi:hypothetical protein
MEPNFADQWTIRVELRGDSFHCTSAFAWLWGQILRQNLDSRQVFTTFGTRSVAFNSKYKQMAMDFKLRWG